ncbi:MAG: FMN-dependent NADH-azoreductase [Boseongicola sp.]|nr:MAG: FMN-dependent NADH-azoreductase [Boseongicola sp.]
MPTKILRIDASARREGSVTRELNDHIIERFRANGDAAVTTRDLTEALPQVTETWIGANFTPADDRNPGQHEVLSQSDGLIEELKSADIVLIGLPIYNFGMPAALKAWIDLVARAGVTFQYTENGPKGLLEGKRAIVSVASGGTETGSDWDFATGYLRHVLSFIGITDVLFVSADKMAIEPETTLKSAHAAIATLPLAA